MTLYNDFQTIASIDWDDEPYQFNMTKVFVKNSDGSVWHASDSGCSCPMPFEDTTEADLTPISRTQDWYDFVNQRIDGDSTVITQVERSIEAVRAALKRHRELTTISFN